MSILNNFSLEGKTALVTGCKKGIGKAIAIGLAEAGANIIGVSSSLELKNSDVENAIQSIGKNFFAYQCDLSKRKSLYKFISEIKIKHSQIDVLINNAGTILRAPIEKHTDEMWDNVIDLNQNAQFILAREFGKDMVERGSGKIIFITSLLAFQGGISVPSYAASKGATMQLTKALSNEWAAKGVNVNAIAPGYIKTAITEPLRNDIDRNKSIISRIPMGRWGKPKDIVGSTVFLASEASSYLSGTTIFIDGGWMSF